MVIGGNGSGKSAGIAIPTMRTYRGTMLVVDVKGELSDYYQKLLRQGTVTRPCIIFDPTKVDGPSYDPFWWVMQDSAMNLVMNIWEIAKIIAPISPETKEPFWQASEQAVLAAALVRYFKLGLSFSEAICRVTSLNLSVLCKELEESQDSDVKKILGEILDMKEERRADFDRGLRNKILPLAVDPYICHAFRGVREGAGCFTWNDLENCNIFLRIPADKIDQWGGAITLICTQLIRYLERRPEQYSAEGRNCVQTLLLLDEFPRLGKMEVLTSALATLRSKKVNICLMVQSIAQLDKIYGTYDRRIIFDNCQFQAILRANDAETQKYLSELIGSCVCRHNSVSESLDRDRNTVGFSKSIGEIREWAVYPHTLSMLKDVLVLTPSGFCRAEKIPPGTGPECQFLDWLPVFASTADKEDKVLISNAGARMLTSEERTENAWRRVTEALLQQQQTRQDGAAAQGAYSGEYFIHKIAELVLQWFPEVQEMETNYQEGDADWYRPLEGVLSQLADKQTLLTEMKRNAAWPDP